MWIGLLIGFASGSLVSALVTAVMVDEWWRKKLKKNPYYECDIPDEIEPEEKSE